MAISKKQLRMREVIQDIKDDMAEQKEKKKSPKKLNITDNSEYANAFKEFKSYKDEMDYFNELKTSINNYDVNYLDYIKKSIDWNKNAHEFMDRNSENCRIYQHYLMTMAFRPIFRSNEPGSTAQGVGFFIGMYLASSDFRHFCKDAAYRTVIPFLDRQTERHGPNSKWSSYRQALQDQITGGRPRMTGRSAALMKLGMMQRAYDDMRLPNANPEKIMTGYNRAIHMFDRHCKKDGISEESLNRNIRVIVGEISEKDPTYCSFINEFADGTVNRKHDPYKKNLFLNTETDEVEEYQVWNGDYSSPNGKKYTGGFTLRPPFQEGKYEDYFTNKFTKDLMACETSEDVHNVYNSVVVAQETVFKEHKDYDNKARSDLKYHDEYALDMTWLSDDLKNASPYFCNELVKESFNTAIRQFSIEKNELFADWIKDYLSDNLDLDNDGIDDREQDQTPESIKKESEEILQNKIDELEEYDPLQDYTDEDGNVYYQDYYRDLEQKNIENKIKEENEKKIVNSKIIDNLIENSGNSVSKFKNSSDSKNRNDMRDTEHKIRERRKYVEENKDKLRKEKLANIRKEFKQSMFNDLSNSVVDSDKTTNDQFEF